MSFPIVKMENKNPPNVPFRLYYVDLDLIQQCLGPPQTPAETAAPTVEALSHTYAVKSPLVTMVRSKFAPKSTHSGGPIAKPQNLPHPWSVDPSDLWCRTAAGCDLPFFHSALDRQTDRPTDRTRESLMTIGRCAPRATRPNNTCNTANTRCNHHCNTLMQSRLIAATYCTTRYRLHKLLCGMVGPLGVCVFVVIVCVCDMF